MVFDADTDRPLGGARIMATWADYRIDSATKALVSAEFSAQTLTDAQGQYRLCGVRTNDELFVQVRHDSRASDSFGMTIDDAAGVLVRNFSVSADGAVSITAMDTAGGDAPVRAPLAGTATLTGFVRGSGGQPIVGAQVRLVRADASTRTDERGAYTLTRLPAGTRELEVRHLGHRVERVLVELRRDRATTHELILQRSVDLDSVRVVAERSKYKAFEEHRARNFMGRFLDEREIARYSAASVSQIVATASGFRVLGGPRGPVVFNSRGGSCRSLIVVDRIVTNDIDEIPVSAVAAMEFYADGIGVPPEYVSVAGFHSHRCGVILIWTKR